MINCQPGKWVWLGTLLAGWLITRYGFNRCFYLASVLFAVATMGMVMLDGFYSWTMLRFTAGVGCALIWVVVESALLCSGTVRNRGQLLAAYMIIYYLGTVAGQLLVSRVSTELLHVIPWVTALIICAVLPVVFVHVNASAATEEASTSHLWVMLRRRSSRLGLWLDAFISVASGHE
jgi:UMF2 family putative MFS family transporter